MTSPGVCCRNISAAITVFLLTANWVVHVRGTRKSMTKALHACRGCWPAWASEVYFEHSKNKALRFYHTRYLNDRTSLHSFVVSGLKLVCLHKFYVGRVHLQDFAFVSFPGSEHPTEAQVDECDHSGWQTERHPLRMLAHRRAPDNASLFYVSSNSWYYLS